MAKKATSPATNHIVNLLHEAGILLLGRFTDGENFAPLNFNFNVLPSYPDILRVLAKGIKELTEDLPLERLASTQSSIPLAVATSLETSLPVVYSTDSQQSPMCNFIGAYDIGHPAVLIAHTAGDPSISDILNSAHRVGLEIHTLISILDTGKPHQVETPIRTLLHLDDVVNQLRQSCHLPQGHAQEIFKWIGKTHRD